MTDLRKKLESEVLQAPWAALLPHAQRDGLFLVAAGVALVDVALAIAQDDHATVKGWLHDATMRRPNAQELAAWEESPVAFEALIVQPFVVARPIPSSHAS